VSWLVNMCLNGGMRVRVRNIKVVDFGRVNWKGGDAWTARTLGLSALIHPTGAAGTKATQCAGQPCLNPSHPPSHCPLTPPTGAAGDGEHDAQHRGEEEAGGRGGGGRRHHRGGGGGAAAGVCACAWQWAGQWWQRGCVRMCVRMCCT